MLLEKLSRVIQEHNLLETGDRVVVAVSGGPDSIAMLHMLHTLAKEENGRWFIIAAHLNHGFRGAEAEADALYVEKFCHQLGVPVEIETTDVPAYMKRVGKGAQETAREVRYTFLTKTAKKWGANKIATAHHADDQAETILMRIVRGTGLDGLQGMLWKREFGGVEIIRPLLFIAKEDLEAYCLRHEIQPRLDQSNLSLKYTRNRFRLEVFPLLKQINPRVGESLLRLADLVSMENDYMHVQAKKTLESITVKREPGRLDVNLSLFLQTHTALQRRMCQLILNYLFKNGQRELSLAFVDEILRFIETSSPSSRMYLPEQGEVRKSYDKVIFSSERMEHSVAFYVCQLAIPGKTSIEETGAFLYSRTLDVTPDKQIVFPTDGNSNVALFDLELLHLPLTVRNRREGDRMALMRGGTKKLKEILIDCKIPREERGLLPILADGERVLWVPGVVRSGNALVTPATRSLLIVEYHPGK